MSSCLFCGLFSFGCSVSGVAFSFNGGKDSTVLLHIIRAAIILPLPERTPDLNTGDHGE